MKMSLKGTEQRNLTGVKSGIHRKLMISSIPTGLLFFKLKGTCPFKFKKKTFFSILINFREAFLGNVAYADKLCCSVAP
jgi:hypothetical protein